MSRASAQEIRERRAQILSGPVRVFAHYTHTHAQKNTPLLPSTERNRGPALYGSMRICVRVRGNDD